MRKLRRLPLWRGRQQHGRHELDETAAAAAAAAEAWVNDLGRGSMDLAAELHERRQRGAAVAIERHVLETAELWPALTDSTDRLPPGWQVAYQTPGLGAAEPGEAPGLGAGNAPAIALAARILGEAGTVDGALLLAANALRVLGEISQPLREGLDEDTWRLVALLGQDQAGELVELDERRGDA